jgi:hypothetical protein
MFRGLFKILNSREFKGKVSTYYITKEASERYAAETGFRVQVASSVNESKQLHLDLAEQGSQT